MEDKGFWLAIPLGIFSLFSLMWFIAVDSPNFAIFIKDPEWIQALAALIIIVVTAIPIWQSKNRFIQSLRPDISLSLESMDPFNLNGDLSIIKLVVENQGKTTAKNIKLKLLFGEKDTVLGRGSNGINFSDTNIFSKEGFSFLSQGKGTKIVLHDLRALDEENKEFRFKIEATWEDESGWKDSRIYNFNLKDYYTEIQEISPHTRISRGIENLNKKSNKNMELIAGKLDTVNKTLTRELTYVSLGLKEETQLHLQKRSLLLSEEIAKITERGLPRDNQKAASILRDMGFDAQYSFSDLVIVKIDLNEFGIVDTTLVFNGNHWNVSFVNLNTGENLAIFDPSRILTVPLYHED